VSHDEESQRRETGISFLQDLSESIPLAYQFLGSANFPLEFLAEVSNDSLDVSQVTTTGFGLSQRRPWIAKGGEERLRGHVKFGVERDFRISETNLP
jgi:hypothetical protein